MRKNTAGKKIKRLLVIFIAFIIILAVYAYSSRLREMNYIQQYGNTVTKYCFMYNVDANFVMAVIKAESNFDEKAVSDKGALGLMQIIPSTGAYIAGMLGENYSEEKLLGYETNIRYGTYYIGYLWDKFTDPGTVAAAYNAGEGNAVYWLSKYSSDNITLDYIPFAETRSYVEKVKRYYAEYKNNYYNY